MKSIGDLPAHINLNNALDSIGENIIIADKDYNIRWMNSNAAKLFEVIVPLYGLSSPEDLIGMNMDRFHKKPQYQQAIMDKLSEGHRARIKIKDRFVADIVITPIKNEDSEIEGYVVMLMDVTTKAEEEKKKEKMLQDLSVPILTIWKDTIAIPLIGSFDEERAERMITSVLNECTANRIQYVLISLIGLHTFDEQIKRTIQNLCECLRLLGAQCIVIGISPDLAMTIGSLDKSIPTFSNAHAGLQHILQLQEK